MEHPLEASPQRLRHRLRRPSRQPRQVNAPNVVTPPFGQTRRIGERPAVQIRPPSRRRWRRLKAALRWWAAPACVSAPPDPGSGETLLVGEPVASAVCELEAGGGEEEDEGEGC